LGRGLSRWFEEDGEGEEEEKEKEEEEEEEEEDHFVHPGIPTINDVSIDTNNRHL
jgi:hypothetical protein